MFKIESNIRLVESKRKSYPFKNMECGESFFSPVVGRDASRLRTAATAYGRYHGTKFICRVTTEDGVKGIRVWMLGRIVDAT